MYAAVGAVAVAAAAVAPDAKGFRVQGGRYKATWKREFKLPWRKAGLLKSSG